jgi:hypothetical protein
MMPSQAPHRERSELVLERFGWVLYPLLAGWLRSDCVVGRFVDCVNENANLAMVAAGLVACDGGRLRCRADDGDPGFGGTCGAGAGRDHSRGGEVGQPADSGRGGGDCGAGR